MNWIEKGIAALSPGWAAERSKSRNLMNAYEAANPSRLHKAKRSGVSADNAVFAAGVSLREQARWLDENHDIVIGILDKLEAGDRCAWDSGGAATADARRQAA